MIISLIDRAKYKCKRASYREYLMYFNGGGGVRGKEPNHTTARKPSPL
jgi:hypothetical protein